MADGVEYPTGGETEGTEETEQGTALEELEKAQARLDAEKPA